MAEKMRCPQCGGLNPADAQWCGQCLTSFVEPEPEPEPEPATVAAPAGPAPPADIELASAQSGLERASTPPEGAIGTQRGAFKVTETGISWICARCDTDNPMAEAYCATCGAPFAETVRPKEQRDPKDPGAATLWSLVFPGAGHGYMGLWGQAVARAVLHMWLILVFFVAATGEGGGARFTAVIFGLAATALWAISAHDAYREARLESRFVILQGRRFMFAVLGMLLLLMITMVATGLSARGG